MTYPNTLIFVDFPSTDRGGGSAVHAEVFGWDVEGRPTGVFHRAVPGQHFQLDDGRPSPVGNLHLGIFDVTNARPHPDPAGADPRALSAGGRPRIWILVSDDDTQDRILDTAEKLGATVLWRDHYWAEFNGFNGAFRDPWGNTVILWTKGGDEPNIPEGFTRE